MQITWEKFDISPDPEEMSNNVLVTPVGVIDIFKAITSNKFNLWICHTNFKLSKDHIDQLNHNIEGVEGVQIISPYRLLIAIAISFDEESVKNDIESAFCVNFNLEMTPEILQDVERVKNLLKSFKNWCIYIAPNGYVSYTYLEDDEIKFQEDQQLFIDAEKECGGLILCPHE